MKMTDTSKLSLAKYLDYSAGGVLAQAIWITVFAAATALGAQVEISHHPVPYTLQTFAVLLAGAFLGARNGAMSQLLYIAAGCLGAPVFAGGAFGIAKLLGPTGGYLAGFPVAAAVVGYLVQQRRNLLWHFLSMGLGLLIVFSFGTAHLYAFHMPDFSSAFSSGFLLFTWWDMLKLSAAAMIYHELSKRWPKVPK